MLLQTALRTAVRGSFLSSSAAAFSTESAAEPKLKLKITRSDLVTAKRWAELDETEARFQDHLTSGEWKGKVHCAATSYWPRLRQYRDGRESWLCEAMDEDTYMGHYIVSGRDVYFEGEPHTVAYGYLARVAPKLQTQGVGKFLMAQCIKDFGKTHSVTHGTMARTNLAQLKVLTITRKITGSKFQGEGAIYLVDPADVPKVAVPANARVARLDAEQECENQWEKLYGKEGMRLRTHTAEILQSPLHGGHYVISNGEDSAGLSIWNPNFGVTVDKDGVKHKRTLFYNLWSRGPNGTELLKALYSQRLQEAPFRFVLVSVWRTKIAAPEQRREHLFPEVPTYASLPIEHFISPHSLGMEEEMVTIQFGSYFKDKRVPREEQPCFVWDQRDCSTLLSFHEPIQEFTF